MMKVFVVLAICVSLVAGVVHPNDAENITASDDEEALYYDYEEYEGESDNLTLRLEELSANAQGIEIFMLALEDVVLAGGDTVKIPSEIDPDEHNITLDDALDRLEEFVSTQLGFTQNFLSQIEEEMGKLDEDTTPQSLQDAKSQLLEIIGSLNDAKEDIGDYKKSQMIEDMYDYYYNDEQDAKDVIQKMKAGFDEDPFHTEKEINDYRIQVTQEFLNQIDDTVLDDNDYIKEVSDLETTAYPYINDAIVANEDYTYKHEENEADIDEDIAYQTEQAVLDGNAVFTTAAEHHPTTTEEEPIIDDLDDNRYSKIDVDDYGFNFPTYIFIIAVVGLFSCFAALMACVVHTRRRRSRVVQAKTLNELQKEETVSVVSIWDIHKYNNMHQPVGSVLPPYLDVISERVEPTQA